MTNYLNNSNKIIRFHICKLGVTSQTSISKLIEYLEGCEDNEMFKCKLDKRFVSPPQVVHQSSVELVKTLRTIAG